MRPTIRDRTGKAERFVQTFKQYFKAEGTQNIKQNLARFLFSYRTTPNSTTGQTPAEIFLNRRPKTRLDLLRPDLGRRVESKQNNQKVAHDAHSKNREFQVDEKVLVQNFRGDTKMARSYGSRKNRTSFIQSNDR